MKVRFLKWMEENMPPAQRGKRRTIEQELECGWQWHHIEGECSEDQYHTELVALQARSPTWLTRERELGPSWPLSFFPSML